MINRIKTGLFAILKPQGHSPFSAGGWATATYIAVYALDALLFLPLARLLDPADFGVYAEAGLVYSGLILVLQLTLSRAMVRTQGDLAEVARATFWLSIIAGLIGAILCAASGFLLAAVYDNSNLVIIMAMLFPAPLGAALGSVPFALLTRELDFRRRMLPEIIGVGVGSVGGLVAALLGAGVYSLIILVLVRNTLSAAVAWVVVWKRPEIRALRAAIADKGFASFMRHPSAFVSRLLGFGIPAGGGELALYARFNIDYAVAGAQLGDTALGVYSLAWKTSDRSSRLLNAFFDEVGYATFSRLQTNRERLMRVYLSATRLFLVIGVPVFLGAILIRTELIHALFKPVWWGMIGPLLPFFLLQLLWMVFHPSAGLVLALGHSRVYAWVNGLSLALTFGAVLIGVEGGIIGLSWAMLAATGATSVTWGLLAWVYLRPGLSRFWQTVKLPLLFAATNLPPIAAISWLTGEAELSPFIRLGLDVLVALIVFGATAWFCRAALKADIANLRERLPEQAPLAALPDEPLLAEGSPEIESLAVKPN